MNISSKKDILVNTNRSLSITNLFRRKQHYGTLTIRKGMLV